MITVGCHTATATASSTSTLDSLNSRLSVAATHSVGASLTELLLYPRLASYHKRQHN